MYVGTSLTKTLKVNEINEEQHRWPLGMRVVAYMWLGTHVYACMLRVGPPPLHEERLTPTDSVAYVTHGTSLRHERLKGVYCPNENK